MATRQLSCAVRNLLRRCARGDRAARGDEQLLEQFAKHRDEAAFEAMVARHGPMVLEVCRRALFDAAAAEDAFQATFLVLIQKAGSIRKGALLGSWLHGVAFRIAARARVEAARRRARESASATAAQTTDPLAQMTMRECLAVLDQEITRLPARHRAPLVLCYLEGRTRDEAAHELGYSLATLDRRLKESRERLRGRLTARGVTLSGALLAAALGEQAGRAAVPIPLAVSTIKLAAGTAAGASVTALTEGVLKGMLLSKIKLVFALLVFGAVLGVGTGTLILHTWAANRTGETPVKTPVTSAPVAGQLGKKGAPGAGESGKKRTASDLDKLQGTWAAVSCEMNGKADPEAVPKGLRLTIEGNRFTLRPKLALHFPHGTFTLDASKQPRTIDFTQTHGLPKEEPVLIPGIYKLDGTTLKICLAEPGGKRPADFTTKPGSGRELLVFRRPAAGGAKQDAPVPDAWSRTVNGLSGRLRIVFAEKHIPASNRGGVIMTERTLVWLDSQVELKNDSARPLAVPNHFLLEARVFDTAGKEIKDRQPPPADATGIVPLAWRNVPVGGSLGGYVSLPAYLSRIGSFVPLETSRSRVKGDGTVLLFLGERQWLLKPGRYRVDATLTVEKAKSSPADAWWGRLELPPIEFAVTPEQVATPKSNTVYRSITTDSLKVFSNGGTGRCSGRFLRNLDIFTLTTRGLIRLRRITPSVRSRLTSHNSP